MDYVHSVDVGDLLKGRDFDIVAKLASVWDEFDDNQLAQLESLSSTKLDALVKRISSADLAALSTTVRNKIGFGSKIVDRLKSITAADVANWGTEQWQRVPWDNLISMDWTVLQEVPISEVGKWTQVWICLSFAWTRTDKMAEG